MTTTRQPSSADKRAEAIFAQANRDAHAYIGRISKTPSSQAAVEARLGTEIGILHSEIRQLCLEIEELRAASRAQGERIEQLQFDAAKGDDEFEQQSADLQRRITAFHNRSTGAADALRGL